MFAESKGQQSNVIIMQRYRNSSQSTEKKDRYKLTGNKHNNCKFLEPFDVIKLPILADALIIHMEQESSNELLSSTETVHMLSDMNTCISIRA